MGIPGIPQNPIIQTANQQNLISWDLSAGAMSYIIQRSLDNVTFTTLVTISGSPLATSYVDAAVSLGVNYWYKVAANNTSGTSPYTIALSATPTQTAEKTLGQLRLAAMQRADRVNSNFVTTQEWNDYINQAMFELYDLLVTVFDDYFLAPPIQFVADGTTYLYPLPNGSNTFLNANNPTQTITPPAFYKLMGVDLALNNATNAYVTINRFNFIDRNRFVYPNTASTIYGVFNLQYRVMGNNIMFIPTPTGGQSIRLWYVPRLQELLQDTDTTSISISGWDEYVIVRAAKYALDKEESDSSKMDAQLLYLKSRIEETAASRDIGQPDKISNTRGNNGFGYGGYGSGDGWGRGGFMIGLIPTFASNDKANHSLAHAVSFCQSSLTYGLCAIGLSYLCYLNFGKLRGRISFAFMGKKLAFSKLTSTFSKHVSSINKRSTKK